MQSIIIIIMGGIAVFTALICLIHNIYEAYHFHFSDDNCVVPRLPVGIVAGFIGPLGLLLIDQEWDRLNMTWWIYVPLALIAPFAASGAILYADKLGARHSSAGK